MDELRTLKTLRDARVDRCETAIAQAHRAVTAAQTALSACQDVHQRYQAELPDLITKVYIDILGQQVDAQVVMAATQKEAQLRLVLSSHEHQVQVAQQELTNAQEALALARQEYARALQKQDAMDDLVMTQISAEIAVKEAKEVKSLEG